MKTHNNILPYFSGFYNTIHEERIDERLGFYLNDQECTDEEQKEYDKLTSEDFRNEQAIYAKEYFDAFVLENEEILKKNKITLVFQKFHFPKEYNYVNDQIWIEVKGTDDETFFDSIFTDPEGDMNIYYSMN